MIRVVLPPMPSRDEKMASALVVTGRRKASNKKGRGRDDEARCAARRRALSGADEPCRAGSRLFRAARDRRYLAQGGGRGQMHDLLHVRLPLRHQSPSEGWRHPLHRGQPRSPGQSRRDLRQGRLGHHAAAIAGETAQAPEAGRRARLRRVPRDRMGRGDRDRGRMAGADPRQRPEKARLFHRPRPEPVVDRVLGGPVRHAEFRRAWRVLLGQHGGGRHVHARRQLLGVRRARLGAYPLLHDVRGRRRP